MKRRAGWDRSLVASTAPATAHRMAGVYVPRSPTTGVLYGVVRTHLVAFLEAVERRTDGLPPFVITEFLTPPAPHSSAHEVAHPPALAASTVSTRPAGLRRRRVLTPCLGHYTPRASRGVGSQGSSSDVT